MSAAPHILIGGRRVSAQDPCFVIAEIGVNHNGDLALARELVDAAVEAGADAVKFQTFRTAALVTPTARKAAYQEVQTGAGGQAEMLAALELPQAAFAELRAQCDERGVAFISTAFDPESLEQVIALDPPCLKWPSGELNNAPLLRQAAQSGLPIILSTGMAQLSEVAASIELLAEAGGGDVAILHCVSSYPAPLAEQNLRCIATMSQAFGKVTGFSDHTDGPWAALAARGLGMAILEKHITLDRSMSGPDHAASLEPGAFARMVTLLRETEAALGDGVKRPMPCELDARVAARKSLVFADDLPGGHMLAETDLLAKRPAGGISPDKRDFFVGRRLRRAVRADEQLVPDDVG